MPEPITTAEIAHLRELHEKATPGEWVEASDRSAAGNYARRAREGASPPASPASPLSSAWFLVAAGAFTTSVLFWWVQFQHDLLLWPEARPVLTSLDGVRREIREMRWVIARFEQEVAGW